jgi:hypothetical protein
MKSNELGPVEGAMTGEKEEAAVEEGEEAAVSAPRCFAEVSPLLFFSFFCASVASFGRYTPNKEVIKSAKGLSS